MLPTVSLNGYVAAGSLPNGTIITSSARRMARPSVCGNEVLEQAHSRARDGSLIQATARRFSRRWSGGEPGSPPPLRYELPAAGYA
jgi:hypothetical protein